ncbi:MAG: hypothetical protein MZV64_11220 [Ignavibacteriales bacterium]|nr:hypothetical protein [Ignavibacteriales bacterium]
MRKGILELAILGALSRGRHYGYSLVRTISGGERHRPHGRDDLSHPGPSGQGGSGPLRMGRVEPGPAPQVLHADRQGRGGLPGPRRGVPQARRDRRPTPGPRRPPGRARHANLNVLAVTKETDQWLTDSAGRSAQIVDNYLERLKKGLKGIPAKDQDELVREINSHIYESFRNDPDSRRGRPHPQGPRQARRAGRGHLGPHARGHGDAGQEEKAAVPDPGRASSSPSSASPSASAAWARPSA